MRQDVDAVCERLSREELPASQHRAQHSKLRTLEAEAIEAAQHGESGNHSEEHDDEQGGRVHRLQRAAVTQHGNQHHGADFHIEHKPLLTEVAARLSGIGCYHVLAPKRPHGRPPTPAGAQSVEHARVASTGRRIQIDREFEVRHRCPGGHRPQRQPRRQAQSDNPTE